jgi:hypothetical protein
MTVRHATARRSARAPRSQNRDAHRRDGSSGQTLHPSLSGGQCDLAIAFRIETQTGTLKQRRGVIVDVNEQVYVLRLTCTNIHATLTGTRVELFHLSGHVACFTTDSMIWCHFNNQLSTFAVAPPSGEIMRIVGSTVPT